MKNFLYRLFILLLPITSLHYFYGIFRNWSLNGSLYPLIAIVTLSLFSLKQKYIINYRKKQFLFVLSIYLITTTISSLLISLYLDASATYGDFEAFQKPLANALKTIPKNFVIISVFLIFFTFIKTERDVQTTIRLFYTSFLIVIAYGYIQLFAIFEIRIFHNIYNTLWPFVDGGWAGENRTEPYIFGIPRRLNITMPEASEAAHYFQSAIYPLLLGSLASKHSIYKRHIFKIPIELYVFLLTMPLVFFMRSSAGFFVLFAQLTLAYILYAKAFLNYKEIFFHLLLAVTTTLFAVLIGALVIDNITGDNFEVILKIFDKEHGSTNTRYALTLAGFYVFLTFPIFGAGQGNANLFMQEFIPEWALNNYEIINAIETKSIPILNYWVDMLAAYGVVGFFIYIYMFYITAKPYLLLKPKSNRDLYLKNSFIIYVLSTALHGFNSSSPAFIYLWAIWAFYLCQINARNSYELASQGADPSCSSTIAKGTR